MKIFPYQDPPRCPGCGTLLRPKGHPVHTQDDVRPEVPMKFSDGSWENEKPYIHLKCPICKCPWQMETAEKF